MTKRVTIREASDVLGLSVDTIRRRLRSGALVGERRETPQGFVWYVEVSDDSAASPGQSPTHSPMRDDVAQIVTLLSEQLAVKDEQIGGLTRTLEDMQRDHAREIEQLHVLLQTAQQTEQRLLRATIPDAPESPQASLREESAMRTAQTPQRVTERPQRAGALRAGWRWPWQKRG